MSHRPFRAPVRLDETVAVPRLASLEDVQLFLLTLDDAALGEALRPLRERIERMRTRSAETDREKRRAS